MAKPHRNTTRKREVGQIPVRGRHQITGVQRVARCLEEIEYLQRELYYAGEGLRATLTIKGARAAYADFVAKGGVTAADWARWLDGKALNRKSSQRGKRHLRIVG